MEDCRRIAKAGTPPLPVTRRGGCPDCFHSLPIAALLTVRERRGLLTQGEVLGEIKWVRDKAAKARWSPSPSAHAERNCTGMAGSAQRGCSSRWPVPNSLSKNFLGPEASPFRPGGLQAGRGPFQLVQDREPNREQLQTGASSLRLRVRQDTAYEGWLPVLALTISLFDKYSRFAKNAKRGSARVRREAPEHRGRGTPPPRDAGGGPVLDPGREAQGCPRARRPVPDRPGGLAEIPHRQSAPRDPRRSPAQARPRRGRRGDSPGGVRGRSAGKGVRGSPGQRRSRGSPEVQTGALRPRLPTSCFPKSAAPASSRPSSGGRPRPWSF